MALAGIADSRSAAQDASAERTTLSGIYTEAQVVRGEDTYYGSCVNCHPKGTYSGASFKANWVGKSLADLYDWVLNRMSKSDPGTLTPEQSADVIAYILKENRMPSGQATLPTDAAVLRTIRIELPREDK